MAATIEEAEMRLLAIVFVIFSFVSYGSASASDTFKEELFIKPLDSGHTYFHFQFTTIWNASIQDRETFHHYRLFPKSLGDVVSTYGVQELHLSQTQGLWRHEKWGYPVEDAPPGAEFWVWFKPTVKNVDQTWAELVNAVSGLFCTSLNFLDGKSTVAPRWSFRPRGVATEGYTYSTKFVRYGALPSEIVCTENLTPWKKLLPCNTKVGLATLFKAVKLYDASYHSLATHIRPVCQDPGCRQQAIELSLSLSLVVDTTVINAGYPNWSLKSVFGHSLSTQCPLSSISAVYVDVSDQDAKKFKLTPEPTRRETFVRGGDSRMYAVYDVGEATSSGKILNIAARFDRALTFFDIQPPPLFTQRYITGYGLERGGVMCEVHNTLSSNLTVIYMDTLPWFMRVFYKSLTINNNGTTIRPFKIHYIPGKDRSRSYQFEIVFRLRANSVTTISYEFERAFLKWTEYPPDANHGFPINSAIISTVLTDASNYTSPGQESSVFGTSMKDESDQFFLRIHTESLLVSLPTPDFSMPYNVICLACTVVAIAFGSIHNLTTRRFIVSDPSKKKGLLAKVKAFFRKGEKKAEEKAEEESEEKSGEEVKNRDNNESSTTRKRKDAGKD
ncbi:GPI transamidase component PIG-T-like [Haliotis cracherodii]|uniref:GPI transamidase component PIG-T-like n=1 Tax=Haliotis rufescens TaxID=6454 RepID=UPI00201EE144|nr:GPI transamidase component PIG-T-like [Haliotis rufescens]